MNDLTLSRPTVVISLDFEMRWGMHDKLGTDRDRYRQNLEDVRLVVPALLQMFAQRNIRATWACVGALACENWDDFFSQAPPPPAYADPALAVKEAYAQMDPSGELHFAPDLVDSIHAAPGQEIGTHTFSHVFMREPGFTEEDARADIQAVFSLWEKKYNCRPASLVFPRNQYAFLELLHSMGIRIFRGNQGPWFFNCNESKSSTKVPRALRLLDDLNPLIRRSYPHRQGQTQASLFVRYNLNRVGWKLHSLRIRNELDSLLPGHVLHLWWHPHNLGGDIRTRLARAEQILDLVAEKLERRSVESKNMKELLL